MEIEEKEPDTEIKSEGGREKSILHRKRIAVVARMMLDKHKQREFAAVPYQANHE